MKLIENIKYKFKKWREGEYIPPPPNDPSSTLVICSAGYYKKPLIVNLFHRLWDFWKKTWKILLPLIITAIVALFIHFDSKSTSKTEQEKKNTKTERHIENPPSEQTPKPKSNGKGAIEVINI